MAIGSINATGIMGSGFNGSNNSMQTDPVSKDLQRQITEAQKRLQELSTDKEMSMEDKMKKRQEIQQEITMLNQQLRQHQLELRKEQQQKSENIPEKEEYNNSKTDDGISSLSSKSMESIISAESSMKQAKVQGSVALGMENRAGVLEIEIKLDAASGGASDKKKQELADIKGQAQQVRAAQASTLAEASQKAKKANEDVQNDTNVILEETEESGTDKMEEEKDEDIVKSGLKHVTGVGEKVDVYA